MNRAIKNSVRGKQSGPLPAKAPPSPAQNIQNFDGRANTSAGKFETQAIRGTTADGMQVQWEGIVK